MKLASNAEFARICRVTPSRVSHWKRDGLISGAAIVGEGRSAKIDVEKARQQLGSRRDPGQALGNGKKTNLQPAASVDGDHVVARLDYALGCERIARAGGPKAQRALTDLVASARQHLTLSEIKLIDQVVKGHLTT